MKRIHVGILLCALFAPFAVGQQVGVFANPDGTLKSPSNLMISWGHISGAPSFSGQVNADWNASSGVAQILNKPTIPAAQVQSDWNASSGPALILNKPTLGTAAAQSTSAFDAAGAAAAAQSASLQKSSNLADLANAATARANLGLGSSATQASSAFDSAGAASAAQSAAQSYADTNKLAKSSNLSDVANIASARASLGLDTGNSPIFANVTVAGGVLGSIGQFDQLKINPELGYPSGGSITLGFNGKCNVYIPLTVNATFADSGLAAGVQMLLTLKNTTGGTLSLAWPSGWNWDESGPPASIGSGQYMTIRINSIGTTDSSVVASFVGRGASLGNLFYVSDYGATGNGSNDDTSAIENCITAAATAHGCAVVTPGTYRCTSAITLPGSYTGYFSVRGFGSKVSKLRFDGATNGLDFDIATSPATNGVEVADLGLLANNSGCGAALKLNGGSGSAQNEDHHNSTIHGVEVAAVSGGWNTGFNFINCWHLHVSEVYAYGNASNYTNSTGAGGGSAMHFLSCVNCSVDGFESAEFWHRGIWLEAGGSVGNDQGIVIRGLVVVEAVTCIDSDNGTLYLSNFVLDNGNLDTAHTGINIVNTSTSTITNGQILQKNGSNQIVVSNSQRIAISGVDFSYRDFSGASVLVENSSLDCSVTGCTFGAGNLEVQCNAGTSGCHAISNTNSGARNNIDSGSNHLGDALSFTGVVVVPSSPGTTYTFSVAITDAGLGKKPWAALAQSMSDQVYAVRYDYDNVSNSATAAYLVLYKLDGSTLGATDSVRWGLQVSP